MEIWWETQQNDTTQWSVTNLTFFRPLWKKAPFWATSQSPLTTAIMEYLSWLAMSCAIYLWYCDVILLTSCLPLICITHAACAAIISKRRQFIGLCMLTIKTFQSCISYNSLTVVKIWILVLRVNFYRLRCPAWAYQTPGQGNRSPLNSWKPGERSGKKPWRGKRQK